MELSFHALRKTYGWISEAEVKQLTRSEISRKLIMIRRDELNTIVNEYLSYKREDALEALPPGPLRARWEIRKKQRELEQHESDIKGFLRTVQFLKNLKEARKEAH